MHNILMAYQAEMIGSAYTKNPMAYIRPLLNIPQAEDFSTLFCSELIAGAYKRTDTSAFLRTVDGHTIFLDASANSGTITLDGVSYPLSEQPPATSGRRLEEQDKHIETVNSRISHLEAENARLQENLERITHRLSQLEALRERE